MKTKKQIESEGFSVTFTNGSGAGGQKRNRTYSVAVVKHVLTGYEERCDKTRSANKNMNIAYNDILSKLEEDKVNAGLTKINELRKQAVDNGVIRTYNFKSGTVKDHRTGKKAPLKQILNGKLDLLK